MDTPGALETIRVAAAGLARVAERDVASLDDLVEQHRAMCGVLAARKELRSVLPALKRLRAACERTIRELEMWPQ